MERIPRSWSLEEEKLLEKYNDIAKTHSLIHLKSSHYYSTVDSAVSTSSIILNCLLGGGSLASLLNTAICDNIMAILIPFGVCSTVSAVLSTVSKRYKFGEMASDHHKYATDYNTLSLKIEFQLSLKKEKRTEVYQFIAGIEERFEEIQEKAPIFPHHIEKRYLTAHEQRHIIKEKSSRFIKDTPIQIEFQKRMDTKYKCIKKDIVMEELRRSSEDSIKNIV